MHPLSKLFFAVAFAVLTVVACTTTTTVTTTRGDAGTGEPEEDGGPSDAGTASAGGVTLAIREVSAAIEISNKTASAGNELVIVGIELGNVGSVFPVTPMFASFTLTTTDALSTGVELVASTAIDQACPQNTTVDQGGTLRCALVFQAKQDAAKELRYALPSGETLSVAVPAIPRCHTLPPAGSVVTSVQVTSNGTLAAPTTPIAPPPDGTYVLTSAKTFGQPMQYEPWTFRITSGKVEQTQKTPSGEVVFRESGTLDTERVYSFGTNYDHLRFTFGCASPDRGSPKNVDYVFQYQASTQTLILQEDSTVELRFKKTG